MEGGTRGGGARLRTEPAWKMRGNSTYRGDEVERKGCWRCVIVSSKDLNLLIYVKYFVFQFGDLAEICENRDKIHRPKKVLFFRQSIVFIVKLDPFFIMICRKDPFCRIWNIVGGWWILSSNLVSKS